MGTTICACCKSIISHGTDYWYVNDAITEEIKGMPERFKVIDNATTPLKSISELKKGDTICEPCYKQLNSPNIFKKKNQAWWINRTFKFSEDCLAADVYTELYGNKIVTNIVTVGATTVIFGLLKPENVKESLIDSILSRFRELNIKTFEKGV